MRKASPKKIVVFDLDETIGHFEEFGRFIDGLAALSEGGQFKYRHKTKAFEHITQKHFNELLDLYPDFFRPSIFKLAVGHPIFLPKPLPLSTVPLKVYGRFKRYFACFISPSLSALRILLLLSRPCLSSRIGMIETFMPSDAPIFFKVEISPSLLRPNLKFSPTAICLA